jgi:GH35 family endo-1,4-beta-xylanase
LINDGTSEAHETTGEYEALVKGLLQQHVRIEGIGIQFHVYNRGAMLSGKSLPPAQVQAVYERLGRLGLPLYITEITVPSSGTDGPELQAAIVANLYRLWFSTPQMAGVTWWNLGDGTAFQEKNQALGGLLDKEMNLKPAYRALDRLINQEWKTTLTLSTDAAGEARFRGFHGKYSIKLATGGATREYAFELKRGSDPSRATFSLH